MRMKKTTVVFAILAMIMGFAFARAATGADLIIVASKATQEASQNWVGFLKTSEVPFKLVTPQEFANYKQQKYHFFLGGVDEMEGIAGPVKEALTKDEFQWVSQPGNGKLYVKSDIWAPGQRIVIVAGSDLKASEEARKTTREQWFAILTDWFDLEQGPGGLHTY